jgi:ABC-2 type transport system permease protein
MIIMCIAIPKNSRINTGGNIAPAILKMYYGQMTGFFIMIYTIITANSLIASQVDRGSMAYVLSTPIKRTTVIFTQMCYLISAIFIMILLVMLTNTICFIAQRSSKLVFNFGDIALMALGCFLLQVALASISFMASCIFNLSKYSFALGAGAPVGFYLLSTLSQISGLESLKYLTIFTLFNVGSAQDPTSNG